MKDADKEESKIRKETEKHVSEMLSNQRMVEFSLKKYSQIASDN